ncbi:MAG TPA: YtxH domain-containing protein [Candidatus Limnocylindria bacterium]|nr:YtxH domain-containing protein [Candidatus Limnocylindria bacterium]
MHENQNGGQGLAGFVLGAAVGAGIALLLAPCSGQETRSKISGAARKLKSEAGHRLEGMTDKIHDVKESVRSTAKDVGAAVSAGRDAYRRGPQETPVTREVV